MKRLMVLVFALVVGTASAAWAVPGALDTTYSGDGVTSTAYGTGTDLVVDSSGRYVVGGQVLPGRTDSGRPSIMRYKPNGALDATFSGDGKMSLPIAGAVQGLGLQNGNITVATETALWRLLSDGRLDTTFGGDGRIDLPFGEAVTGQHPMWATQAKVYLLVRDSAGQPLVNRITDDGSVVGSYPPSWYLDDVSSIALHQGFAYVLGSVADSNGARRVVVGRMTTPDLAWDDTFNGGRGVAYGTPIVYDEFGYVTSYTPTDIAVNATTGKFAVVGKKYACSTGDCSSYNSGFAMMFTASGGLDTAWGNNAEAYVVCTNLRGANAVAFQGAKLLVGGSGYDTDGYGTPVFSLDRLTSTGVRDSTWSRTAVCPPSTNPTVGSDLEDLAFMAGKVVAVGGRFTARYLA